MSPSDPSTSETSPSTQTSTAAVIGLTILCLSFMINAMDRQVYYPLLKAISGEYQFSLPQAGVLATGFTLGLAAAGFGAGYLLDRMERRMVVVISVVVYSVGTLLIPLATGFGDMFAYRLLSGLGEGVQATALYAIIGAFYYHRRALAAGFVGVAFGIGVSLGPIVGQALANAGGTWRIPFYVFGLIGLVVAAVILVSVPRSMSEAVAGATPAPPASYEHVPANPYNRNLVSFGITAAIAGLVFYGFLGLYPTFLAEQLGFTPTQAAWGSSMTGFGAMMALPIGWLSDRYDQRVIMAVGFVGTAVSGYFAYQVATTPGVQYFLAFLIGAFASGVLFTNCTTVLQRSVRPEHVGRGAGTFMLAYYVAAAFAGLLFTTFVGSLGWGGAGLIQIALVPLLGVVALLLVDPHKMLLPPGMRIFARR